MAPQPSAIFSAPPSIQEEARGSFERIGPVWKPNMEMPFRGALAPNDGRMPSAIWCSSSGAIDVVMPTDFVEYHSAFVSVSKTAPALVRVFCLHMSIERTTSIGSFDAGSAAQFATGSSTV